MVVLHLITVLHIVLSCRAARDQIKYFVVVDAAAAAAPSQLLPLLRSCIQKCKLKCSPSSETRARHGSTQHGVCAAHHRKVINGHKKSPGSGHCDTPSAGGTNTMANIINSDMYSMDTARIHAAEDVPCGMSSMGISMYKISSIECIKAR